MEKVIVMGARWARSSGREVRQSLEELNRLVETAGGRVLETVIQRRHAPDPATCIGKGKVEELHHRLHAANVRTVVFDEDLRPVQQRNLETRLEVKIVDRTRLILDIFARRARTREGILQVELAQLAYRLPRLTGRGIFLDSQVGGIGTRGPGERKLEVDRRVIRDRIATLQKEVGRIRKERRIQRSMRQGVPEPQVAIIGYTNTGKSTLLNALTQRFGARRGEADARKVYADDKLFATLDPTTRRVRLPSGRAALFTDTVGFIRKLPTELIAAFRATLEEITVADLLLEVRDASDPAKEDQAAAVQSILKDLRLEEMPRLAIYNKVDQLRFHEKQALQRTGEILISARTAEGLSDLLPTIEAKLSEGWEEREVFLSFQRSGALARFHEEAQVLKTAYGPKGVRVRLRAHPETLARLLHMNGIDDHAIPIPSPLRGRGAG